MGETFSIEYETDIVTIVNHLTGNQARFDIKNKTVHIDIIALDPVFNPTSISRIYKELQAKGLDVLVISGNKAVFNGIVVLFFEETSVRVSNARTNLFIDFKIDSEDCVAIESRILAFIVGSHWFTPVIEYIEARGYMVSKSEEGFLFAVETKNTLYLTNVVTKKEWEFSIKNGQTIEIASFKLWAYRAELTKAFERSNVEIAPSFIISRDIDDSAMDLSLTAGEVLVLKSKSAQVPFSFVTEAGQSGKRVLTLHYKVLKVLGYPAYILRKKLREIGIYLEALNQDEDPIWIERSNRTVVVHYTDIDAVRQFPLYKDGKQEYALNLSLVSDCPYSLDKLVKALEFVSIFVIIEHQCIDPNRKITVKRNHKGWIVSEVIEAKVSATSYFNRLADNQADTDLKALRRVFQEEDIQPIIDAVAVFGGTIPQEEEENMSEANKVVDNMTSPQQVKQYLDPDKNMPTPEAVMFYFKQHQEIMVEQDMLRGRIIELDRRKDSIETARLALLKEDIKRFRDAAIKLSGPNDLYLDVNFEAHKLMKKFVDDLDALNTVSENKQPKAD